MGIFKKLDDHSDLMGKMSDKVGVDWGEKISEHPEMARQYRTAVMTCTQCKSVGECRGWQATHDHADAAPDYCLNKDLLAQLAAD
ncbi:DUF6455 family protein [Shimia thalassica]|uniref:DUF6455 family protein n=1 Tax=Shimia thalassica TaxID=1715693 RepID=UPI0026E489C6|nr:DUF6455 family protein [Shimia thalassica]MDO6482762.1 DUF6455 family protein [Shimia thalassica]